MRRVRDAATGKNDDRLTLSQYALTSITREQKKTMNNLNSRDSNGQLAQGFKPRQIGRAHV